MSRSFESVLRSEITTILFVDVVESVRLIEQDEAAEVHRIRGLLRLFIDDLIPLLGGTLLEQRGDSLLVKFGSCRQAAACAIQMHRRAAHVDRLNAVEPLQLRIALHGARILTDEVAIYGRGVNLAARLAALAMPGGTIVSAQVRDQLTDQLDGELHDMGACFVRHVDQPVHVFALRPVRAAGSAGGPAPGQAASAAHAEPAPARSAGLGPAVAVLAIDTPHHPAAVPSAVDVLCDQLCSALSRSAMLRLISPLSSQALHGRGMTAGQAAQALAADYVITVEWEAQDIASRLGARLALLHRGGGAPVWQHRMCCPLPELLSTDSGALSDAVQGVLAAMTDTELVLAHGLPLPNLAAHTLYLAAVNFLHRFSREDFDRARLMLETLRGLAPRHPAAPAWLARWHVFRIVQRWSPDVSRDGALARDFAQRALDQDPGSSLALTMAGSVEAGVRLDMAQARHYYDLALQSNPNEPLAWLLKGVAHGFMSEGSAALAASERSLQLSPLDPLRFYYDSLSSAAAMGACQFERAAELAQRAIRGNCMHGSAYRALAIAQAMQGQLDEARQTVTRLRAVEPGSTVQQFLARAAVDSEQNRRFGQALAEAGLPAG